MSNNTIHSLMSSVDVRPKLLYISSENVPYDADSSSSTYQLKESIIAQDGYHLEFGVRSFGFNAAATNISKKQNNNTLILKVYSISPQYVLSPETNTFNLDNSPQFIESKFELIFPEGLYTIDELFSLLSDENNYSIESGYKVDVINYLDEFVEYNGQLVRNSLKLSLNFARSTGGFTVGVKMTDQEIKNNYLDINMNRYLAAYEVNYQLKGVSIVRDPVNFGLYDLLFTNKITAPDHPGYIPQFEMNIRNQNPPSSIDFNIFVSLFFEEGVTEQSSDYLSPMNSFIFDTTYDTELNTLQQLDKKYPSLGVLEKNRGARFYHLPDINPLFVDVISDLPVSNVSTSGASKGILVRLFSIGSNNGGTSYYQSFDQIVMYPISSSRDIIESLRLTFQSEGGKWNFFNLDFCLELYICEKSKEGFIQNNEDGANELQSMPITDDVTRLLGSKNNSFPFQRIPKDPSILYLEETRSNKRSR
jgi:hypothetical protein